MIILLGWFCVILFIGILAYPKFKSMRENEKKIYEKKFREVKKDIEV